MPALWSKSINTVYAKKQVPLTEGREPGPETEQGVMPGTLHSGGLHTDDLAPTPKSFPPDQKQPSYSLLH